MSVAMTDQNPQRVGLVTGLRQIEIREFPEPTPAPETAVVQIAYCGICGTDLHAYASGEPYNPAICGHEWTGNVSGVGANVSLKEGADAPFEDLLRRTLRVLSGR